MIVSGMISHLEKKDGKITYLEVKISRVLAVCFDSINLTESSDKYYLNFNMNDGLNYEYLNKNSDFYKNIFSENIFGFIRKTDVIY
jgi:hypothetical protein